MRNFVSFSYDEISLLLKLASSAKMEPFWWEAKNRSWTCHLWSRRRRRLLRKHRHRKLDRKFSAPYRNLSGLVSRNPSCSLVPGCRRGWSGRTRPRFESRERRSCRVPDTRCRVGFLSASSQSSERRRGRKESRDISNWKKSMSIEQHVWLNYREHCSSLKIITPMLFKFQ